MSEVTQFLPVRCYTCNRPCSLFSVQELLQNKNKQLESRSKVQELQKSDPAAAKTEENKVKIQRRRVIEERQKLYLKSLEDGTLNQFLINLKVRRACCISIYMNPSPVYTSYYDARELYGQIFPEITVRSSSHWFCDKCSRQTGVYEFPIMKRIKDSGLNIEEAIQEVFSINGVVVIDEINGSCCVASMKEALHTTLKIYKVEYNTHRSQSMIPSQHAVAQLQMGGSFNNPIPNTIPGLRLNNGASVHQTGFDPQTRSNINNIQRQSLTKARFKLDNFSSQILNSRQNPPIYSQTLNSRQNPPNFSQHMNTLQNTPNSSIFGSHASINNMPLLPNNINMGMLDVASNPSSSNPFASNPSSSNPFASNPYAKGVPPTYFVTPGENMMQSNGGVLQMKESPLSGIVDATGDVTFNEQNIWGNRFATQNDVITPTVNENANPDVIVGSSSDQKTTTYSFDPYDDDVNYNASFFASDSSMLPPM